MESINIEDIKRVYHLKGETLNEIRKELNHLRADIKREKIDNKAQSIQNATDVKDFIEISTYILKLDHLIDRQKNNNIVTGLVEIKEETGLTSIEEQDKRLVGRNEQEILYQLLTNEYDKREENLKSKIETSKNSFKDNTILSTKNGYHKSGITLTSLSGIFTIVLLLPETLKTNSVFNYTYSTYFLNSYPNLNEYFLVFYYLLLFSTLIIWIKAYSWQQKNNKFKDRLKKEKNRLDLFIEFIEIRRRYEEIRNEERIYEEIRNEERTYEEIRNEGRRNKNRVDNVYGRFDFDSLKEYFMSPLWYCENLQGFVQKKISLFWYFKHLFRNIILTSSRSYCILDSDLSDTIANNLIQKLEIKNIIRKTKTTILTEYEIDYSNYIKMKHELSDSDLGEIFNL